MTMGAFKPETVSRFKGREKGNVVALRGFWFDIEGSSEKFSKPGGEAGGYPNAKAVVTAISAFGHAVPDLVPNYFVSTGSGGVHVHYVLSEHITLGEWLGRARTLVELAAKHGFKIDAQCTTDPARIMRAPGSLHQETGVEVKAVRLREEPYTLKEWDQLTGHDPASLPVSLPRIATGPEVLGINGDVLDGRYNPYSYKQAAGKCGAMLRAAQSNGRDTAYPIWILAARSAALSVEGHEFAHEISSGHPDYDRADADRKLDSLTGGPADKGAWANAYGTGGPCDSCALRELCKNPAVQFGTLVDVSPVGEVEATDPAAVVEWVRELNIRYAIVRQGTKMVIVDFQTPSMTGRGMVMGFGYLDIEAFRHLYRGRFVPADNPKEKARPLATAWLEHADRRQYAGLVFAPGQKLPPDILNLWQGFALEPVAGDISLWLEVLSALVPTASDRAYVLRWIAWKIQNPGGVPDTILIFTGAKGTGKNSLFDPVVLLFGRHAMIVSDPELIAGRFTGHLMDKSLAVLDEAVFVGDPRQMERIKSRVTAKISLYEHKGMDPVQGINCCAYVMLTNHPYVWQATTDERRAVVLEVGESLRGNLEFWGHYYSWVAGPGPAALLHHLQSVDLTGFNPRHIPKGEALRKQVEETALRDPAAAWWHQCLSEGAIRLNESGVTLTLHLNDTEETEISCERLRLSYEQSAAARVRNGGDWAAAARKVMAWAGLGGARKLRKRSSSKARMYSYAFTTLPALREAFTAATQVRFDD